MKKNKLFLKILIIGTIIVSIYFKLGITNIVLAEDENTNTIENTIENTTEDTNTTENTTIEPEQPAEPKSIEKLTKKIDATLKAYTGKAQIRSVELWDGSYKLVNDTDYTVTYTNNINPGKGFIIVKGIGNYTGTITKYFYISPKKSTITKVTFDSKCTKATIIWQKDNMADGYKIYMSNSKNGSYHLIKTFTTNSTIKYIKSGLSSKKDYYFKVAAYKQTDGKILIKYYSDPVSGTKLLSKVTLTSPSSGANRNYNLKRASDKINGLILKPGQTFNWFKVVGPASKARGYKLATIFKNGKVAQGYGGGVCQVSTTLFQASRKLGLKIVERHMHSLPVTYTTRGNDATVSYGVQNLRIKNNKKYSIKLVTTANGKSTTCEIYRILN